MAPTIAETETTPYNDPLIRIISYTMPYNELLLQGKMDLGGFPTKSLSDPAVRALKLPEEQTYVQALLYTSSTQVPAVTRAHGLMEAKESFAAFARRLHARHIVACGIAQLGHFRHDEEEEMTLRYGNGTNISVYPYPHKLRFTLLHRLERPVKFNWLGHGGSFFGSPLTIEKEKLGEVWKTVRAQLPSANG